MRELHYKDTGIGSRTVEEVVFKYDPKVREAAQRCADHFTGPETWFRGSSEGLPVWNGSGTCAILVPGRVGVDDNTRSPLLQAASEELGGVRWTQLSNWNNSIDPPEDGWRIVRDAFQAVVDARA